MQKRLIIILFAINFFFLFMTVELTAQNKKKSLVLVKSDPIGAMVQFKGENSFIGITPFRLRPDIRGKYEIFAAKEGFERKKFDYFFSGTEKGTLKIILSPKTRFKAGLRSMVFPGWGQLYSERKTSAVFINLMQISAVIGALVSFDDYNKAVDEYDKALSLYENNKKFYNLRDQYWNTLLKKHEKADNRYEKQQTWFWIAGGVWIYNVLDSIFFFPSFDKDIFNRSVPTLSANYDQGIARVNLSLSF